MNDFTDKELDSLRLLKTRWMNYTILNPDTSPNTFDVQGTFKQFQTLQVRGIVTSNCKGDRTKRLHWFRLTDEGLTLIRTMVEMENL